MLLLIGINGQFSPLLRDKEIHSFEWEACFQYMEMLLWPSYSFIGLAIQTISKNKKCDVIIFFLSLPFFSTKHFCRKAFRKFSKVQRIQKILSGITTSPMERKALAYSKYGELFRYANFVNQVVPEHEKIVLWGKSLVFGNGSLVRRFIYPRKGCVLSSQLSTPEEFLKEFKEQDITYVMFSKRE